MSRDYVGCQLWAGSRLADQAVRRQQAELVPEARIAAGALRQVRQVPEAVVGEQQRPARLLDVHQDYALAALRQAADEGRRVVRKQSRRLLRAGFQIICSVPMSAAHRVLAMIKATKCSQEIAYPNATCRASADRSSTAVRQGVARALQKEPGTGTDLQLIQGRGVALRVADHDLREVGQHVAALGVELTRPVVHDAQRPQAVAEGRDQRRRGVEHDVAELTVDVRVVLEPARGRTAPELVAAARYGFLQACADVRHELQHFHGWCWCRCDQHMSRVRRREPHLPSFRASGTTSISALSGTSTQWQNEVARVTVLPPYPPLLMYAWSPPVNATLATGCGGSRWDLSVNRHCTWEVPNTWGRRLVDPFQGVWVRQKTPCEGCEERRTILKMSDMSFVMASNLGSTTFTPPPVAYILCNHSLVQRAAFGTSGSRHGVRACMTDCAGLACTCSLDAQDWTFGDQC